jgi:hypothetical protein
LPFLIGELAAHGASPGWLAILAYGGETKRQHAPQCILSASVRLKKSVGAIDQNAAKLK